MKLHRIGLFESERPADRALIEGIEKYCLMIDDNFFLRRWVKEIPKLQDEKDEDELEPLLRETVCELFHPLFLRMISQNYSHSVRQVQVFL